MTKRQVVKTNFYADGKLVWVKEYPDVLTDDQISREIEYIKEIGYGVVNVVTDTTGKCLNI